MSRSAYQFPVEALVERLGDRDDHTAAEILGVSLHTLRRWKYVGGLELCHWQADRYACRLGYHPSSVWGQKWWSA